MSRTVVLVTAALGAAALGLGVSLGSRYAALDETEIIAAYAARYAAETGGRIGDCVGRAGTGRAWIVVECRGAVIRRYAVSRWGSEIASGRRFPDGI